MYVSIAWCYACLVLLLAWCYVCMYVLLTKKPRLRSPSIAGSTTLNSEPPSGGRQPAAHRDPARAERICVGTPVAGERGCPVSQGGCKGVEGDGEVRVGEGEGDGGSTFGTPLDCTSTLARPSRGYDRRAVCASAKSVVGHDAAMVEWFWHGFGAELADFG